MGIKNDKRTQKGSEKMTNPTPDEIKGHYEEWNCDSIECHYSEGFQAGQKKAQKEFLDKINDWMNKYLHYHIDTKTINELKQSLGEKGK